MSEAQAIALLAIIVVPFMVGWWLWVRAQPCRECGHGRRDHWAIYDPAYGVYCDACALSDMGHSFTRMRRDAAGEP